jgi:hypothetical protein
MVITFSYKCTNCEKQQKSDLYELSGMTVREEFRNQRFQSASMLRYTYIFFLVNLHNKHVK